MPPQIILPNLENIHHDDAIKTEYHFYNEESRPIHKARVDYKNENRIVLYPYTYNKNRKELKLKRISEIEFLGWERIANLPKDFKLTNGYGLKSKRIRSVFTLIYPKFKDAKKVTIEKGVKNKFLKTKIVFGWEHLNNILKKVGKEFNEFDNDRKLLINNLLATSSNKFRKTEKRLSAGEFEAYLSKFEDFDKITKDDADAIARLIEKLPSGRIITTSHFITTKETLEIVYLEDVITRFKELLQVDRDNEEQWQVFFEKYSWIFNHLFPYQVILRKGKAFVGGKTVENRDGRVVDFLFKNNLDDNFALLEIKTHRKEILKKKEYRAPDVFSLSDELSGGINQCLDQKDAFLKEFGNIEKSYDPKCILVIGLKSGMNKSQKKCFELLRSNQKNVDIVTFDELLSKLEGLHKVLTGKIK
jgi:Domain of unknown function (DUF4263)